MPHLADNCNLALGSMEKMADPALEEQQHVGGRSPSPVGNISFSLAEQQSKHCNRDDEKEHPKE